MGKRIVLVGVVALVACKGAGSQPPGPEATTEATSASASAPVLVPAAASPIDERFRAYEKKLPPPVGLSEGNGFTIRCRDQSYATLTRLAGCARRLAIQNDADLAAIVPWTRHDDPCIRQIAVEAILTKVDFDHNRLVASQMNDPEHFLFREITLSLRAYLDARHVAYDPKIFDGLLLDVGDRDFAPLLRGKWEQDPAPNHLNFLQLVALDAETIRVTQHKVEADPAWPDTTWTTKIKEVHVNEQHQFVVTGVWDVESNEKGWQGTKVEPSRLTYTIMPVKTGVAWIRKGEQGDWKKLRKVGA
jgi:hypothetical protein